MVKLEQKLLDKINCFKWLKGVNNSEEGEQI